VLTLFATLALAADPRPLVQAPSTQQTTRPAPVVGGAPAAPGDWPSAAALSYGAGYVACSGVLIDPSWVLTAGHCASSVQVVHLDTTDTEAPGETLPVADFFAYPDAFNSFDVALVQLAEPSQVTPARLAMECIIEDYLQLDAAATLVGFGAIDPWGQTATSLLHAADLTIRDPACESVYAGCNTAAMPDGELIAGGDGVDSCDGDSGGPLFLHSADGPWLVGITSRAAIPATDPCGDGGIYVRVDSVVSWIEQTAGIYLPRPDCEGINRPPRAEISPIHTGMNAPILAHIDLTDPNPEDLHHIEVETPPLQGAVLLGPAGELLYRPAYGFTGLDPFTLRVTDDGLPPLSTTVAVDVRVHAPHAGQTAGCSHTQAPVGGWLLTCFLTAIAGLSFRQPPCRSGRTASIHRVAARSRQTESQC